MARPDDSHRNRSSLESRIGAQAERKRRAQKRRRRSPWLGIAFFGLVGWSVALPTLAGAIIGGWVDAQASGPTSWTLALLLAGLTIGCVNAWVLINRNRNHDS